MSAILSPEIVQIAGIIIAGAALVQVGFLVASSARRLSVEREQQRLAVNELRYRADLALARSQEERERVETSWNGFRKFEVRRKVPEADGVHSFYLVPHDGKPVPPYKPGQYLTFQLRIPGQPKPVIRCYSLSDSPYRNEYYRVSIKKVPPPRDQPEVPPGLSSTFFNDLVQAADILDVKAPGGHFFLDTAAHAPVVLIAGGIGITPVLSMLNAICDSGSQRETWFFLGVRNGAEHLMKAHLERLDREHDNVRLVVCYSDPRPEDVEGRDYHHKGWVGVDLFRKVLPSSNYEFYICGPPAMMESVTSGLKEWGVPDSDVHFEAFGPATVKKTKSDAPPADEATALNILFNRSGKTFKWNPDFGSILEFAEENGIVIDSGCRAGNCGTCITAVKAGEVAYNIEPGATPEQGSCLTCISVPRTNLTLDA